MLKIVQDTVVGCDTSLAYHCTCADGWRGPRCEYAPPPPALSNGPLIDCGTTGTASQRSKAVIDAFSFAHDFCCLELGESDPGGLLPGTCANADCNRAIQLVQDSCAPVFASDDALSSRYKSELDTIVQTCEDAAATSPLRAPVSHAPPPVPVLC